MKVVISILAILMSSNLALAVCPFAKNLQSNSEVDFFDQSSNAYHIKNSMPSQKSHSPGAVERRK